MRIPEDPSYPSTAISQRRLGGHVSGTIPEFVGSQIPKGSLPGTRIDSEMR